MKRRETRACGDGDVRFTVQHFITKRTVERASSFFLDHSFLHDSIKERAPLFVPSLKPRRLAAVRELTSRALNLPPLRVDLE